MNDRIADITNRLISSIKNGAGVGTVNPLEVDALSLILELKDIAKHAEGMVKIISDDRDLVSVACEYGFNPVDDDGTGWANRMFERNAIRTRAMKDYAKLVGDNK